MAPCFEEAAGDTSGTISGNYANSAMLVGTGSGATVSDGTASNQNGADVALADTEEESWWRDTLGWGGRCCGLNK